MNKKDQIILGIETSCDETAVAIVRNGNEIIANVIASQVDIHQRFGGVVPEVASRHHVERLTIVLEEAFNQSSVSWEDIDAIAVTEGPGLVGALLIGVNSAKALAFAHNIPLISVHHIAGHIYANRFVTEMRFPLIALVVSGGHTELVYMKEHGEYKVIGETRDDAAGEAYDKVARTLGLPYPGGPHIDKLAEKGKATYSLPRAWLEPDSYDFSFSGLKSAVINAVHNANQRGEAIIRENMAASFQESVIEVLVEKTAKAAENYSVKQVLLAGGVAANRGLRKAMTTKLNKMEIELVIPPISLCTDNAAMIAAAGSIEFEKGRRADMRLNGSPGLDLERYNV